MQDSTSAGPLSFSQLLGDWPKEQRSSEWLTLSQAEIGEFGRLTRDPDPNHIDPVYARAHSPFGVPIAFGFQTLAMLTCLLKSAGAFPEDASHVVNYGFEKLRFVSPVPAGASIRGHFRIERVDERKAGQLQVEYAVEVEVRDQPKPALVARWLALFEGPSAA